MIDVSARLLSPDQLTLQSELAGNGIDEAGRVSDLAPVLLCVDTPDAPKQEYIDHLNEAGFTVESVGTKMIFSGSEQRARELADRLQSDYPGIAEAIRSALQRKQNDIFRARDKSVLIGRRTLVMGIINLSPDSFSGDGLRDGSDAVAQARRFLESGADILDIGAMSTRPGSEPIPEELETTRLVTAIRAIRPLTDKLLSADTYRSGPAREALRAGADIVNDVSGLRDPNMARTIAQFGAGVIAMHMQGEPRTMQSQPHYDDLISEIYDSLARSAETALKAGVPKESIMVDPGIGFGKTVDHNLEILRRLREFRGLGYPILIGTSRKGFVGRITGQEVTSRVPGTAATMAIAIANGADVVRIHDVEEMVAVCRMSDAIVRGRSTSETNQRSVAR